MIKIKSIMTKDVVTTKPNSNIMDAARLMMSKSVSSLIVVDNNKPIGILSENDIIKAAISKKNKVEDVMSREFKVVSPTERFSEISRSLSEEKIKRFPVVENEKLIGLITETDMVEAMRDFTRFHQVVQEVVLTIFGLATAFFLFYFSPLKMSIFG